MIRVKYVDALPLRANCDSCMNGFVLLWSLKEVQGTDVPSSDLKEEMSDEGVGEETEDKPSTTASLAEPMEGEMLSGEGEQKPALSDTQGDSQGEEEEEATCTKVCVCVCVRACVRACMHACFQNCNHDNSFIDLLLVRYQKCNECCSLNAFLLLYQTE